MDELQVTYVNTAHSQVGAPVGIVLRRPDGGEFRVYLTADDAGRLSQEVAEQARIAGWDNGNA